MFLIESADQEGAKVGAWIIALVTFPNTGYHTTQPEKVRQLKYVSVNFLCLCREIIMYS